MHIIYKNIDETFNTNLFDGVSGFDTFSVIDSTQAYYHIPIKEEDRAKTAFVVSDRKF